MTRIASLVFVLFAATNVSAQRGGGLHIATAPLASRGYSPPAAFPGSAQSAPPAMAPPLRKNGKFRGNALSGYGFGGYDLGYYPYPFDSPNGDYSGSYPDFNSYYVPPQPYYPLHNFADLPPLPNDHPASARLTLKVPPGYEVTLNGKKVAIGGSRIFESPDLKPDERFTFEVRVAWQDNGKAVEEKRTFVMQAGDHQSLQYLEAPTMSTSHERIERLEK